MTILMDLLQPLCFAETFRGAGEVYPASGIFWIDPWRRRQSIERRMVFEQQDGTVLRELQAVSAENGDARLHATHLSVASWWRGNPGPPSWPAPLTLA
jgi:hypothetical protein